MNKVLTIIKDTIKSNLPLYLPDVKNSDLEKDGAIFYMNGQNGTEFDWFYNNRISDFMVFYNDKKNLGAAKCSLYDDGELILYLYDQKGQNLAKEIRIKLEVTKEDIEKLAIIMKNQADNNSLWDEDIEKMNTDIEITDEEMLEFSQNEE